MDSHQPSNSKSLVEAGLTPDQALVYETLILHGPLQASRIHRKVALSRPLIYKVLGDLERLGLVEKDETKSAVAVFTPAHPLKLKEILDKKFEAAQNAKTALEGTISKLVSDFNLVSGKPGVQFFEGVQGMKAILDDALTSKTEICAYIDIATIESEVPEISRAFGLARQKRGIKKRNIAIDTPANRKLVYAGHMDTVTEERLIPWPSPAFGATMQIYDNKVSYLTFGVQKIGVIITDPQISAMHRTLFEFAWNNPLAYTPKPQAEGIIHESPEVKP